MCNVCFKFFLFKCCCLACSIDEQRDNALSASLANSSLINRSSAPINIPNSALNNSLGGKLFSFVALRNIN